MGFGARVLTSEYAPHSLKLSLGGAFSLVTRRAAWSRVALRRVCAITPPLRGAVGGAFGAMALPG